MRSASIALHPTAFFAFFGSPCCLAENGIQGRRLRPGEKEEEQKLNLTFRMMLGVRVAVGRQANLADVGALQETDFGQACTE